MRMRGVEGSLGEGEGGIINLSQEFFSIAKVLSDSDVTVDLQVARSVLYFKVQQAEFLYLLQYETWNRLRGSSSVQIYYFCNPSVGMSTYGEIRSTCRRPTSQ